LLIALPEKQKNSDSQGKCLSMQPPVFTGLSALMKARKNKTVSPICQAEKLQYCSH
jgi:hypothetical protein